jgi:hypothetical protein
VRLENAMPQSFEALLTRLAVTNQTQFALSQRREGWTHSVIECITFSAARLHAPTVGTIGVNNLIYIANVDLMSHFFRKAIPTNNHVAIIRMPGDHDISLNSYLPQQLGLCDCSWQIGQH